MFSVKHWLKSVNIVPKRGDFGTIWKLDGRGVPNVGLCLKKLVKGGK